MAEKKSRSERMYGNGPTITDEPEEGDKNRSGHQEEAHAAAKKTAGKSETKADMKSGGEAAADVMAGTDGIETHHTQSNEREAMHGRHMVAHAGMHGRHEKEHLARALGHAKESHEDMADRHEKEMRTMHTSHEREHREMSARHAGKMDKDGTGPSGGIEEKEVGKSGTNKE